MIKTLTTLVLIYIAYCGLLFLLQRHALFPRHMMQTPPGDGPAIPGMERIWLNTDAGRVEAWYLPPKPTASEPARQPARQSARMESTEGAVMAPTPDDPAPMAVPAVIFGHGNGELIDYWPEALSPFARMGIGLMLVEYPGYGRSGGAPSQSAIAGAFVAAYDHLAARPDVDADRIILFGRSLGGGAVCQLAARRPSAAMILMSTFTSARSFAIRYLAPGFLMRDPFDNLAVVRDYNNPVLVIHGSHDDIIPCRHGAALAQAAKNGRLITYECGHNDCPPDWERFWKDLADFLAANGLIAD